MKIRMKEKTRRSLSRLSSMAMAAAFACGSCMVGYASEDSTDAAALIGDMSTTQAFTDDPVAEEDIETILQAGINSPSSMNGQPWHFTAITDSEVLQQISDGMGGDFGGTPPAGVMEGFTEADADVEAGSEAALEAESAAAGENDSEENAGTGETESGEEGSAAGEDEEAGAEGETIGAADGEAGEAESGGTGEDGFEVPEDFDINSVVSGSVSAKAGVTDAPLAIVISCEDGSEFDAGLACQAMSAEAQLLGYGTKIISSPTIALNGENQAEYKELLGIPEDQTAVAILLVGTADTSVDASSSATERNAAEETVTYVNPE